MRRFLTCIFLFLLLVAPVRAAGIKAVASIAPQAWFVQRIAGDMVEVSVMVPPGATPHGFEPRPSSMRAVAAADVYLALGLEFERAWLPRFLGANPGLHVAHTDAGIDKNADALVAHAVQGNKVHPGKGMHGDHEQDHHRAEGAMDAYRGHDVAEGARHHDEAMEHHAESEHGDHAGEGSEYHGHQHHDGEDPHIWLSPELAKTMASNIRDALAKADPAHAAAYDAGLTALLADIRELQAELHARFTGLNRREFMIFHPSWGWFAREFGLEQLPVEVGGREPSPSELTHLVARAKTLGVRTVFVQPQASRRAAQVLAAEIGGAVAVADPLAPDWAANIRAVAERFEQAMRE